MQPTVHTTTTGRIEPERIPAYVGQNVAQVAFAGILRAYKDPVIYADYLRWKREREKEGGTGHEH